VSIIMPRAPLPLSGFINAVGRPSTKRVSVPMAVKIFFIKLMTTSKVPLVRSMLMATSIPTR